MKIRSITYFFHPGYPLDPVALEQAGEFLAAARPAYEAAGYEVQTTRLVTPPFGRLVEPLTAESLIEYARELEGWAKAIGADYVALGPALPDQLESYALIPEVLHETEIIFFSGMLTGAAGISLPAVHACAEVIHCTTPLSPDGFTNLRFAAAANVLPGGPFFPTAYGGSAGPTFALAAEAAGLAVAACAEAARLESARLVLIERVESHARSLSAVAEGLAGRFGVPFGGIDFSLAPFPQPKLSFGTALECLGVPAVGLHGSLAAAAFWMDALDSAQFLRAGFSGLMLPLLEDAVLAQRAAEGCLSVKDLLLYSAVCGTGLDTLPLPGDVAAGELAGILLDVAALALRLNKPLTARLMPVPGKKAGDPTGFDFAYFANSRVLPLQARPLTGLLASDETFPVRPRQS